MLYNSTQNAAEVVSSAQAIAQGISKDGGLFVPQEFPKYDENTLKALLKTGYKGRAKKVFSDFLTDFTEEEINDCVEKAYTSEKFGGEIPAPLTFCNLDGKALNILELWHGPTCA
ncbi:MAG: threonine synthase, partial [Ruminococcus sp.]|nr:threonine synthase [Ruminococcus sp.]